MTYLMSGRVMTAVNSENVLYLLLVDEEGVHSSSLVQELWGRPSDVYVFISCFV